MRKCERSQIECGRCNDATQSWMVYSPSLCGETGEKQKGRKTFITHAHGLFDDSHRFRIEKKIKSNQFMRKPFLINGLDCHTKAVVTLE